MTQNVDACLRKVDRVRRDIVAQFHGQFVCVSCKRMEYSLLQGVHILGLLLLIGLHYFNK